MAEPGHRSCSYWWMPLRLASGTGMDRRRNFVFEETAMKMKMLGMAIAILCFLPGICGAEDVFYSMPLAL